MRERATWLLMMGLIFGALACGGVEPLGNDGRSIQDVTTPLGIGASGSDVRTVYDYLYRYGYFENPDLRRQYPDWVPAILLKADPDHYDASLEAAVKVYQRLSGLEQTGQVDQATLALMQTARCGHPDVDKSLLDEQQKFSLNSFSYPSGANVTYGFTTTFTTAQKTAVRAALATWQNTTNLTFTENTSNPSAANMKFLIGTPSCGGAGCTLTNSSFNVITGSVTTISTTVAANIALLQHVATHESGHGLGLAHSSFPEAVMFASAVNAPLALTTDDAVAISMKYAAFETLAGTAFRIAASNSGAVWKLDFNVFLTGGSQISRWNESSKTWTVASSTVGATNIAPISATEIYYTQSTGDIWHWTNVFSGGAPVKLTHLNGPLSFISANGGSTWVLGGPYVANCGYTTYALSGSSWVNKGGCAISLALEAGGAAWTASAVGAVRRYNGSTWSAMGTTAVNVLAVSGTLGTAGFAAWMNDFNDDDSNSLLRTWNQDGSAWVLPRSIGVGRQMAVAALGQVWSTNIDTGAITRQRRD